jgi:hypothetical protein
MGQEIVYCSVCGERILESHFKKGKAVTLLKKNYCPMCAKDVVKEGQVKGGATLSAAEPPSPRKLETRRVPLADKRYRPGGKFPIPLPFLVAIAVGVIAVILLIIVLSRGGQ